ncbi:hypothetical protein CN982_25245 [Bacillus cereus]|nr:hypothetical protein CN982_25245 [Bacillus cereus]
MYTFVVYFEDIRKFDVKSMFKGNECKLIFKSLHLIKVKKSPMFMGFFFIFWIILYQLNIDDNLVKVCFILLRINILIIIDK